MPHSRTDIVSARRMFFTATDETIRATRELIAKLQGELAAIENARRAVNIVMGEEEVPLELTDPVKPSIKDLAAKLTGNGQ